jgi:hypothetical protein
MHKVSLDRQVGGIAISQHQKLLPYCAAVLLIETEEKAVGVAYLFSFIYRIVDETFQFLLTFSFGVMVVVKFA